MTTIATGGFSTHDASLSYYDSAVVEAITTVGMILGSLPFLLYLLALQGRVGVLFKDSQVQWFFKVLVVVILFVAGWLWLVNDVDPLNSIRLSSFNVVSVMTGTGRLCY